MALDSSKNIELHVAGICFRKTKDSLEVFVFKRSPQKRILPNLWECGGGQVRPGESLKEAIVREIQEETNLEVEPLMLFEDYTISAPMLPQKIIPGVKFICLVKNTRVKIILQESHTEYRWLKEQDLKKQHIDFIPGIDNDIKKAFSLIKKLALI
jgi:8-oxo-dGTP pyrophosphatase MutT (NUDIX family)